jgi:hypothetical protein
MSTISNAWIAKQLINVAHKEADEENWEREHGY